MDIHGPLPTRVEARCPGGVSVSYLASRTRHECPRHNKGYIWRLENGCGPTLYRKSHSHNTPGKRQNNAWVEPLAGTCTTSSTRQREQVWQKCKIQKNWCTVIVATTIEHHGGHSPTPVNQRWDQVRGRNQRLKRRTKEALQDIDVNVFIIKRKNQIFVHKLNVEGVKTYFIYEIFISAKWQWYWPNVYHVW